MNALLFLQTSLASVASEADQSDFLACMSYLLAAKNGHISGDAEAATQIVNGSAPRGDSKAVSAYTWRQRTAVFEALLGFFPESSRQPSEDLVAVSAAEVTAL